MWCMLGDQGDRSKASLHTREYSVPTLLQAQGKNKAQIHAQHRGVGRQLGGGRIIGRGCVKASPTALTLHQLRPGLALHPDVGPRVHQQLHHAHTPLQGRLLQRSPPHCALFKE